MLMTSDVQLKSTQTPFGLVDFVQIVGICAEELKAAQQWNGAGVLDMISRKPS
jgi:suppressor of fused-like protein